MKFSTFTSSLLLAATAVSAKRYAIGYDAIKASSPGLLSGATTRLPSQVFKGLNYDLTDAYVVNLDAELLSLLQPASSPNVLSNTPKEVGTRVGRISRADATQTFNMNKVSFACAIEAAGETVPVSCTVLFEAATNSLSGIPRQETVEYDGGSSMALANLQFKDIRNFAFTITEAGLVGDLNTPVTLLLDNLIYGLIPAAK